MSALPPASPGSPESAGRSAPAEPPEAATVPEGPWATGVGSMPGTDVSGTLDAVLAELGAAGLPFVPELPARGVGADMVGRGAGFLVDLPVDLQPSGWRLVDRPGRDLRRARAHWRDDLDALAERATELAGARALKVAVAGPWTLAAALQRQRGEVAVSDSGARRDVVESLAEGVRGVLADVANAAPGVRLVLQVDEPSIGAVLTGRLPTASGYGTLRAVEPAEVRAGLRTVLDAARGSGAGVLVHSCDPGAPWRLLREAGADGLVLPSRADQGGPDPVGATRAEDHRAGQTAPVIVPAGARATAWEQRAALVEDGTMLVLGVLDPVGPLPRPDEAAAAVLRPWRDLGLPSKQLSQVAVAPDCGAAGGTPSAAVQQLRVLTRAAEELAERAVS